MDTKYSNHNLSNFRRGSTNFRPGGGGGGSQPSEQKLTRKKRGGVFVGVGFGISPAILWS